MDLLDNNSAFLQLEETLHILEDSLQHNVFYNSLEKHYIKRLKQLYSPRFDIEHSETGSYYHAALQCIKAFYLDTESIYQIPLSDKFKTSMHYLLAINSYTSDTNTYHSKQTDSFLSLSELWGLQNTLDIADLLVQALIRMRIDLINTYEASIKH
jgi:hypothetical protein